MKRYTTRFFKTVAMVYLAFPIVYLIVIAVIFDVPASSLVRILLSPLFYLVSTLAVVTGYGLLEMKRWSWYLLVVTDLLVLYVSALILNDYGEAHHKLVAFLAVAGATLLAAYRLGREIRVPYFFPKIAWWESDPRYRISVPVRIFPAVGEALDGEILDLSLGGCFVKTRVDVSMDQKATLEFAVFGYSIRCEGGHRVENPEHRHPSAGRGDQVSRARTRAAPASAHHHASPEASAAPPGRQRLSVNAIGVLIFLQPVAPLPPQTVYAASPIIS